MVLIEVSGFFFMCIERVLRINGIETEVRKLLLSTDCTG